MSQYLILSSNYRDRLLYPNPADFIIPYGVVNNPNENYFDVLNTRNPISFGLPIFNITWTNFNEDDTAVYKSRIVAGTSLKPILERESMQNLLKIDYNPPENVLYALSQPISESADILKKYFFRIKVNDSTYYRQITSFDPVTNEIELESALPQISIGNECDIIHPLGLYEEDIQQSVFLGGNFDKLNAIRTFDKSLFIYNVGINEVQEVDSYNYKTGIAKLKSPFTKPVKLNDHFIVSSPGKPIHMGSLYLFNHGEYYQTLPNDIQISRKGKGYRKGQKVIMRSNEELQEGADYFHVFEIKNTNENEEFGEMEIKNPKKQKIKLGVTYTVLFLNDNIIVPLVEAATFSVISTSLVFCVDLGNYSAKDIASFYGNYFYPLILSPVYQLQNEILLLQPNNTINPESDNIPLTLLESQSILGTAGIRAVIPYEDNLAFIVTQKYTDTSKLDFLAELVRREIYPPDYMYGITNFQIVPFSEEGVSPLNFSGALVRHTNLQCHALRIVNLILANKILSVGEGLLTSSYPYVFVDIINETNPAGGNYSQIVSNNPFSQKASFICSISDVNNPESSPFIKLSSDGAHQLVKFSPNDNLRIRVTLPNGAPFRTDDTDFHVPNLPNPLLQTTVVLHAEPIQK